MLQIVFIVLAVIYGFVYLILAAKTGRPFKTVLLFAAAGIVGLLAVNLMAKYSGVSVPVNAFTVSAGAALGLPGTVGLLLLRMIFLS